MNLQRLRVSRRVLEQITTLCPPFRGSRSFLSVLGKQFFHSNVSWTGWHIWWHWQRENERKTLGFQNFCSARKLWMDPVALVGRKTRARQGHLSLCTRLLPVKGKSFAWKIPAREDFFETWIVENMLQEREAGYWPSPFWWVSLPKFFGSEFRQQSLNNQQCSGISCFKMDETKYCWKAGFSSPLSDSFNKWFHRHLV